MTSQAVSRTGLQPTRIGEWWGYRGDRGLTGRATGCRGNIRQPHVAWRQFCGTRETYVVLDPVPGGEQSLSLPADDLAAPNWPALARDWQLGGVWVEQDGLKCLPPNTNEKQGALFPGDDAWYRLVFDSLFDTYGTTTDRRVKGYGRLFRRQAEGWQLLWRSPNIPILFIANPIVGDFDGDGRLEVAITPWYDLHVLDLATGERKAKARFKPPKAQSGRAYGWVGAYDVDGCGQHEFIIIADFENHIETLGWRKGRLRRRWHHLIEPGITRKNTIIRPGALPVQDITGDGKLEIVLSIFDQYGDDQWHVVALDGATGGCLLDIPGYQLAGAHDIDGDGISELFCTATAGRLVPTDAHLTLVSYASRQLTTLWELDRAQFQLGDQPAWPLNVASSAAAGCETLLVGSGSDGAALFATRQTATSGAIRLRVWRTAKHGRPAPTVEAAGPGLALAGIDPARGLLLRVFHSADQPSEVTVRHAMARRTLSRCVGGVPASVSVGRLQPNEGPTVIAAGANDRLLAWRLEAASRPTISWRCPGRVPCTRAESAVREGGPVLADLTGDGRLETIAASSAPNGCARLATYRADGSALWHHDWPQFPAGVPSWNTPGLTLFFAGRLTSTKRCDVLVSLRRSSMHSDETYALDGRTGEMLWRRDEGPLGLGCGGGWLALYDWDGDGLDEAVSFYPHAFSVIKGATGELLHASEARQAFGCDAFYALPVVAPLTAGRPHVVFAGASYVLGMLTADLQPLWQTAPRAGTPAVPQALGDIDGDGRLELGGPGYTHVSSTTAQAFDCLDALTGQSRFRLPLPGSCFTGNNRAFPDSPSAPAVGDIDGDGRDEWVFAVGHTLLAVGSSSDGRDGMIRWQVTLLDQLGTPTLADVSGDGTLQIVVACADGWVYGLAEGLTTVGTVY